MVYCFTMTHPSSLSCRLRKCWRTCD